MTRDEFDALVNRTMSNEVEFPLLLLVLAAKRSGVAIDADLNGRLCARYSRTPEQLAELASWVDAIFEGRAACRLIRFCNSVSCNANGGSKVAEIFQAAFDEIGTSLEIESVNCLEQCDIGPSVSFDNRIYVGGKDGVVFDNRTWHASQP